MSLTSHQREWSNCSQCNLCKTRHKVCIYRGGTPCSVLFVGEAPGLMEDLNAVPFCGPAGQLLNKCILGAKSKWSSKYLHSTGNFAPALSFGFTNLVACIPKDSYSSPIRPPSPDEIQACSERLMETIHLASPKLIILVGKTAYQGMLSQCGLEIDDPCIGKRTSYLRFSTDQRVPMESIIHPSAILRSDSYSSQVDALTQRLYEIFLRYFG